MVQKRSIIHTACILALLFLITGCEKLLEIEPSRSELPSDLVYKSDTLAKSAMSGAYSSFGSSQTYSNLLTVTMALTADEVVNLASNSTVGDLENNTYTSDLTTRMRDLWTDLYACLYRFNAIIEGVEGSNLKEQTKTQLSAQAKFMRAYCYYFLVNMYGEVPLLTTTVLNRTSFAPRNKVSEVNAQIIKDLIEAKEGLLTDYSASPTLRVVPNKAAAAALLARVYLYTENWPLAISNATEVINQTSLYSLLPSTELGNVFLKNSREAILQFGAPVLTTDGYTNEGNAFVTAPGATSGIFTLIPATLNVFETGDARRSNWVREVTYGTTKFYEPYKYRFPNNTVALAAGKQESPTALRYAEQYLIRAEAYARSNQSGPALLDLNVIRNRAKVLPSTTTALPALILEIEKERQRELFCELGHRWFDLKRTGRINAVLQALKPNTWKPTAALYPVPQSARETNPNLTQNDGYPQ